MVVLKIIGKILLVPVWILVAMAWLLVKVVVSIYGFARGFLALGLGLLILGTLICYQDWRQVIFLFSISGLLIALLFVGIFFEMSLEKVKHTLGRALFM